MQPFFRQDFIAAIRELDLEYAIRVEPLFDVRGELDCPRVLPLTSCLRYAQGTEIGSLLKLPPSAAIQQLKDLLLTQQFLKRDALTRADAEALLSELHASISTRAPPPPPPTHAHHAR